MEQFVIPVVLLFLKVYVGDAVVIITDYGTDAIMNCTTESASYQWTKIISKSNQILHNSSKYSVTGRSLTIHNTNLNDNGQYQCVVLRSDGSVKGSEIPIELQVLVQVNGIWSTWNSWESCTVTCGNGVQSRRRYCNNPAPQNGGATCSGNNYYQRSCTFSPCAVDGGWSIWDSWGICNGTCGNGEQRRRRYCNNPLPQHGGLLCGGDEFVNRSCTLSYCAVPDQQHSKTTPIAVGTVTGVIILVLILLAVIFAKRKCHNHQKEPAYEITDMTKGKPHIYGETRVYYNHENNIDIEESETGNPYPGDSYLLKRYHISDLIKRFRNKELFQQSLQSEFKVLSTSKQDFKPVNSMYELLDTGIKEDVNQIYLNSSTYAIHNDNVSILLEIPPKHIAEQFWTIVDDKGIENIILLAKESDKVAEFYPSLDDVFTMERLEVEMDFAEKSKNIMLLKLNLQNKIRQSMHQVTIFKTTNWKDSNKYPSVQSLCFLLENASAKRDVPVMIIGRQMTGLSIGGVLSVGLNVTNSSKIHRPFSVLENAMMVNKSSTNFFKNFDDYELLYNVLQCYLESAHTYDIIE